jgi:hypothetical protein
MGRSRAIAHNPADVIGDYSHERSIADAYRGPAGARAAAERGRRRGWRHRRCHRPPPAPPAPSTPRRPPRPPPTPREPARAAPIVVEGMVDEPLRHAIPGRHLGDRRLPPHPGLLERARLPLGRVAVAHVALARPGHAGRARRRRFHPERVSSSWSGVERSSRPLASTTRTTDFIPRGTAPRCGVTGRTRPPSKHTTGCAAATCSMGSE